jgi:flavin-dependent dehydrogenase
VAEDTPELFFCPDLQGYGWVFRKEDVLNVGLGREDNRNISEHVKAFCQSLISAGKIPDDSPARFKGHAYILHGHSQRPTTGEATLLAGDAIGLAYTRSGEGIRPAVESAVMAAEVIVQADGRYDAERLAPYAARLTARFGPRGTDEPGWVPARIREAIAARLLATGWVSRNVVLERWFLHRELAPLGAA